MSAPPVTVHAARGRTVRSQPFAGPAWGAVSLSFLLLVLAATVGLGGPACVTGIVGGLGAFVLLGRALARDEACLGPAGAVTLTRLVLSLAVTALVVERPGTAVPLVSLASTALALDAVDGWLARRTHTATALGARFDMEVDAFLIAVLSVEAGRQYGYWVLALGAARYAFVAAYRLVPWLREPVPFRYWRKVVAATVGVVLTVTASGLLPRWADLAVLALALALLAESFGRDVVWLCRRRLGSAGLTG